MVNLKPAVSTLVIYKDEKGSLQRLVEENQEKIKNWEIIDEGYHRLDRRKIRFLKNLASTRNLSFTVHAPFSSINLAEANQTLRNKFLLFMKKSLENAYSLEAEIWVIHPGRLTPFTYFFPEVAWKAQINSFKRFLKEAEGLGVKVVIENMVGKYSLFKTLDDWLRIVREIEEDVGLCLDVGHAHLTGDLDVFLTKTPQIQHLHIHDNKGLEDSHLPAFEGNINWKKVFKHLKKVNYDGWVVVENYTLNHALKTLKNLNLV